MLPRIIITSPYPEFGIITESICRKLSVEPIIVGGVLEDAVRTVLDIAKKEDIEVVISRGGTANELMNFTEIPVIKAEADEFDVLLALWEAKKISPEKIAFLDSIYHKSSHDYQNIEEILGTSIRRYTFRDFTELQSQIRKAHSDGMKVLVTGSKLGVNMATEIGMQGVIVRSSRRAIIQAIERAKEVIRIRKIDKGYTQRLRTLMDSVKEAILLMDENNRIMLINDEAKSILKLNDQQALHKYIYNVNNIWLEKVYGDGNPCFGNLVEIEGVKVVVNRCLVTNDNENFGSVIRFQGLSALQDLEQKTRKEIHKKGLFTKFTFKDIIGTSKSLSEAIEIAKIYGETDSTVLIYGESGTGKELFAQSIHNVSPRKDGPFVAINCAALPENLLESELFGYEEGSFTGAKKGGKIGLFELAHGGTIFLDEIGKIPLSLQGRLLRVLQEKEVRHLGGDKIIPIDTRVIAATNVNLHEAVQNGDFRPDLYYRINVLQIKLPPLRERKGDVKQLFNYFVENFNKKYGKDVTGISHELESWLEAYDWPGNIRELANFTERLFVLSNGKSIDNNFLKKFIEINDYKNTTLCYGNAEYIAVPSGTLEEMERELILKLYEKTGYNKTKLANKLGISRNTLCKKLNIP
ncbi:Propionate catabolism operon regulatory protein [Pelotomaculum sp. FP]|uniref:sigma-54-dependent Fis family transcriptional regulator n=1 Tax=Pelotomaculum sp. FP TaxID=261474 RepID=UPI00106551CC|nr:sigma-54-dependent Fis family transcriptional regulator [Pelotomaculum sp. FP]TEB12675.1 Propionate catabolism operon regulatory protein [Pelotomaculum sp. FP]